MRENEPNVQAKAVMDFTLPAVNGEPLKMQSLKGKTVVLDFWATWCGPCKVQRPMYQRVEEMYKANPNVVFLSVNTDEDKSLVAPYITQQKWTNPVYFESGLAGHAARAVDSHYHRAESRQAKSSAGWRGSFRSVSSIC